MSTIQGITEDDIANYLANNPAFFARHAQLLASVQLQSPHSHRAVSLQERQMEMLRERIKALEGKIMEMFRAGHENLVVADRLYAWARQLLLVADAAQLPHTLVGDLTHRFMVPQAALRLWGVAPAYQALPEAAAVSADARTFTQSLAQPYCGLNAGFEPVAWLPEPAAAQSVALLPLRLAEGADAFGMLVLASPDATRFSAEMGTEFLQRIGEVASAALHRLITPRAG